MTKYLVISIDVEPDCGPRWQYSNPLGFSGVHKGIGEILQPLFNKYGIKPTYLINNVVLEDKESVATFKKLSGEFELGTHLHPEFIEPFKEFDDYAGQFAKANCREYQPLIEKQKLENITNLFQNCFNQAPLSFRAGRFAAGNNTIESLALLGYKTDTSVTPYIFWAGPTRREPIDYRHAPDQPYFIKDFSITEEDPAGSILEIPVSIASKKVSLTQLLWKTIVTRKLPTSRSARVWLRPKFSDEKQFKWLAEYIADKYVMEDTIVYNMMFHNIEVMPNLNPYTVTEHDCQLFIRSLEWFFDYCNSKGVLSVSMADLYKIYDQKTPQRHKHPKPDQRLKPNLQY